MSATVVTQAEPDVLPAPRSAGAKTFFVWAGLSLLGIPLAGYWGWGVAGHVDSVIPALIGGALTGAGIGFAQWLVLRRSLGIGLEWILATSAGLAIGLAIGAAVVGYETTTSRLLIMGAIQGAFVGIAQGMVLRNKFSLWHVWMVAMPVFFSRRVTSRAVRRATRSGSKPSNESRKCSRFRRIVSQLRPD